MIAGLLILGIAGVNLLQNFRGPVGGLLIVIALVFPVIPEQLGRMRILPRSGGALRVAVLLGLALGAIWVAGRLIDFVTSAGLISEEAREKNEAQKMAGSLLLGGRPEIQVSLRAVMDSPILGYGSWAQDSKYVEMLSDIEVEQGVLDPFDMGELETYLYTHSLPSHGCLGMGGHSWGRVLVLHSLVDSQSNNSTRHSASPIGPHLRIDCFRYVLADYVLAVRLECENVRRRGHHHHG